MVMLESDEKELAVIHSICRLIKWKKIGSGMKMVGHMVVFVVAIWKLVSALNRANISNAS